MIVKNIQVIAPTLFPDTRVFYSENTSKRILLFPYFNYVLTHPHAHMRISNYKINMWLEQSGSLVYWIRWLLFTYNLLKK